MKNLLDKAAIIRLKEQGLSNRGVAYIRRENWHK